MQSDYFKISTIFIQENAIEVESLICQASLGLVRYQLNTSILLRHEATYFVSWYISHPLKMNKISFKFILMNILNIIINQPKMNKHRIMNRLYHVIFNQQNLGETLIFMWLYISVPKHFLLLEYISTIFCL